MKLPDPLSRRHLLDRALEPAKALALAKRYLEDGREVEAIDFLAVARAGSNEEAREALVSLRDEALERGDVFLMRVSSRALDEEPSQRTWQALADAASRAGRSKDAETAQRLAAVDG